MQDQAETKKKENIMREAFAEGLMEAMKRNRDVVYLEADLAGALGTGNVFERYPEQSFNVGIMEANMMGVAAGMSVNGKIPFIHSFGVFASRRIADQLYLSGCYNGANVKVMGSDPGVAAETNGGTHMPLEDMGVLRSFPGLTILDIADTNLMLSAVGKMAETYGMFYVRFPRKGVINYYEEGTKFEFGKGMILREGTDISIIACGLEVQEALKAAGELERKGVSVQVVDMFTVKPIDRDLVIECAEKTGAVVTAENHNRIGGLGSAVAEVLVESCPVPMQRIGSPDVFGEVGDRNFLMKKFEITAGDIVEAALKTVSRKV